MKNLILIILLTLAMGVKGQIFTRHFKTVKVIYNIGGMTYLNTLDGIEAYHESDWLLESTELDSNHCWRLSYYNDTAKRDVVYIYYMRYDICYKMETCYDSESIVYAQETLKVLK